MVAMVFSFQTFISIFIFFVSLPSCFLSSNHASIPTPSGFSAKIINRNSPQSPFYNPNLTRFDRIKATLLRSHTNAASPNTIDTKLRYADSEYVMEYYIGTPAVKTYGVLDTGSSLTWLQCEPCEKCYRQTKAPIFDSRKSSSYNVLSCRDTRCLRMIGTRCKGNSKCQYENAYTDGSYTIGNLAQETLIYDYDDGTNTTRWDVVIGCGHRNANHASDTEGIPGVIGLNMGAASILKQFSYKDFSYCLGDYMEPQKSGYVKFGDASIIKGNKTPLDMTMILNKHLHYYVTLEGITVNRFRLPIPKDAFTVKDPYSLPPRGGFVIDSGSTITELKRTAHDILVNYIHNMFATWKSAKRQRQLEKRMGFHCCYEFTGRTTLKVVPVLTFHFTNADLPMPFSNVWMRILGDTYCLAIYPANDLSLLGNFQQQNYDIGYDLRSNQVSFYYNGNCYDGGV